MSPYWSHANGRNQMGHRPYMYRIRDRQMLAQCMTGFGLSCRALATQAGCSKDTIAWLRKGRIDRVNEHIARSVAAALSLELDDLFEATESVAWQRTGSAIKGPAGRTSEHPTA